MTRAEELTRTLGGRWYGRYGTAACPVCQPERRGDQNGLSLSNGRTRLLLHCKKSSCKFADILAAAGLRDGGYAPPNPARTAERELEALAGAAKRARQARRLWEDAHPISGTPADVYLHARGVTCPFPMTLRYHSRAWHGPTQMRHPVLLARVDGGDGFAVHRTYLSPGGSRKADVHPNKAMLGSCKGGAVRLVEQHARLAVAEGIETALSLACGLLDRPSSIWAALSTSGIRGLRLPVEPGELIIAPDGDPAGLSAAYALADRAHCAGWSVSLLPAPDGQDWNDILTVREDDHERS